MDNFSKYLKYALRVGGLVFLIIGGMHIFLPKFGYPSDISKQMTESVRDHFYYLATYAIGAFLLTFSFLSFYFSKLAYPQNSFVFALSQAVLWSTRTVLEIFYPVKIPLFFLSKPSGLLLLIIITIAAIYSFGSLIFIFGKINKKKHHETEDF